MCPLGLTVQSNCRLHKKDAWNKPDVLFALAFQLRSSEVLLADKGVLNNFTLEPLKDKGNVTMISINLDSDENECNCTRECACAFAVDIAISVWVDSAVRRDLQRVTACLDKWWPALTRRAAFMLCNSFTSKWANHATFWSDMSQQYVRDVTWHRARDGYLVERRVLPGLDHLGWHIATYVYVFDAHREYCRLRNMGLGVNNGGDEYGRYWLC